MTPSEPLGRDSGALPRVMPLGDGAVLLTLADRLDLEANARARAVARDMQGCELPWVTDVVPALVTVAVHFEAGTMREAAERRTMLERLLVQSLHRVARAEEPTIARTIEIPVCYEPPFAEDLLAVAVQTGLTPSAVVAMHSAAPQRVLMIGFAPGQPYLGELDARLTTPRRVIPRHRVEAGAVAIANAQTTIYPFATPGGWNVIGRTPLALFDPMREPASLLEAGDAVVFVPIPSAEFERVACAQRER